MSTHSVQFKNGRRVVTEHANIGTRLLNDVTIGNEFVRVFGVLKLITTVALKVEEQISTVRLCN